MSWTRRGLVAATTLSGAALTWAVAIERRWYAQRSVTVPALRPTARAPLRVLHASDLHLQPRDNGLRRFVDRLQLSAPDLVVVTGDVLDHPDVGFDEAVELLARLRADRAGVLVLGSHDRYVPQFRNPLEYLTRPDRRHLAQGYDTDRFVAQVRESGWLVLNNDRALLQTRAGPVDVVGIDDPHIGRDRLDVIDAGPGQEVALRLGVVHAPYRRVLDRFSSCDFDLVTAGHTHGGQLRVPGIGALIANCDLPLAQTRGLSRYRSLWLHVSAGIGTSRYTPIRFACRPEATVLDLVGRPRGD